MPRTLAALQETSQAIEKRKVAVHAQQKATAPRRRLLRRRHQQAHTLTLEWNWSSMNTQMKN
jgi:hypothetical protein